jgi:hypothetical protein
MNHIETLQAAKHLAPEELESLIRSLTNLFVGKVPKIRKLVRKSRLFALRQGGIYDTMLVQSALLSLVLANVTVIDPVAREHQTNTIVEACRRLGLSFNDVLELTVEEPTLAEILSQADS